MRYVDARHPLRMCRAFPRDWHLFPNHLRPDIYFGQALLTVFGRLPILPDPQCLALDSFLKNVVAKFFVFTMVQTDANSGY